MSEKDSMSELIKQQKEMNDKLEKIIIEKQKNKQYLIKWILGIVSLLASWSIGGAMISIFGADTFLEKYSGIIGLFIGIALLISILRYNKNSENQEED